MGFNQHTELASGHKKSHVPYQHLIEHLTSYLQQKYYPTNFQFKDPQNMTKSDIIQFCRHVYNCQEMDGVENAF